MAVVKIDAKVLNHNVLDGHMNPSHPNLLKFYGYSLSSHNNFCSEGSQLLAFFEFHGITLADENANRQHNQVRKRE